MDVPNVTRTEYQLVNIEDVSSLYLNDKNQADKQGFLNLMDGDGNSKDDVKIPDTDLGKEIETAFEDGKDCMVTIIAAMGESIS
jgi:translation initiation factor 5A